MRMETWESGTFGGIVGMALSVAHGAQCLEGGELRTILLSQVLITFLSSLAGWLHLRDSVSFSVKGDNTFGIISQAT